MSDSIARLTAALADRYRIERELGAGGMATVYLAEDLRHDRKVAIKVLRPELAAVIGAERFLSEIKTTANLQHPHILPLFDSGVADSFLFYVMPYVEGISLRDRMTREKQLPINEAVRIAGEIASALDYAHRQGVIHRDIKPENILLHDGSALVADFGIALAASKAGTRMTETGMSLGTPQYMSPEQAMGERDLDARSDVYALGCVTYEMLTGEPPFSGPTAQAIVAKVMTAEPAEMTTLRKTIPADVADAVHTALQKLPADRFASAKEFADALRGQTGSSTGRMSTRIAARDATTRSSRLRDPIVVALAAIALIAIGGFVWSRTRPQTVAAPAVKFMITASDDVRPFNTFISWAAVVSPDGRYLVYAGVGGPSNFQYYVRRIDQLEARPLPGTVNANQMIFSPDSKWLSFESLNTGKLQKVPLDGGEPIALADAVDNNGGTWSSRGVIVLGSEGKSRGLSRVPESGGALVQFTHVDSTTDDAHLWPLALADGNTIIFTIESGNQRARAQLATTTLDGGAIHPLGITGVRALGFAANRLIYLQANGTVMAVPFDVRGLRVTGTPVSVLDSIPVCRSCNGDAPIYMSSGGALAYIRGTVPARLMWADRTGAMHPATADAHAFANPRVSPDGRRIAVTVSAETDDIWIYDLATGTPTKLTSGGNNSNPEWNKDGSQIFFISDRSGRDGLWHQPANGSGTAELVRGTEGVFVGLVSPDNTTVLTITSEEGGTLWARKFAGDTVRHRIGPGSSPRFSPDGQLLAYVSRESGSAEVVVRPVSGSGARVQLSAGGGGEPVWSQDGRHVYYVNRGRLMVANLASGPALSLASRDSLFVGHSFGDFGGASYDVSRDGKTFLTVQPEERTARLVVALNWGAELAARLGKP
jgi:serine/threonine protein kinase/Tol biopolymer transport system component